ncbi:uncharacterized protein LOC110735798 [Chenopodium quinoa]|uniref:uncharacterized protein LOC110735798 n=1 Tax=Chenopodium quinoa TaxID=63459 RepID=UPI000B790D03|nr:uncharacterized protein LOC110735798 [Chenopodium quinoa]
MACSDMYYYKEKTAGIAAYYKTRRYNRYVRKRRPQVKPRIKWWKLQGENQQKIVRKMEDVGIWSGTIDLDVDAMWSKMEHNIKEGVKEILGESKGSMPPSKDTSWWNVEVQQAIKNKRDCYKMLGICRSDENYEKYKEARKEAKKVIREARMKVNRDLYASLDTKEGETGIYRLTRIRDRKTWDIGKVKCVKDIDQRVLVGDKG